MIPMAKIQIKANLTWAAERTQRNTWVAACDPVGLTLEADTPAELESLIIEGQQLLFEDLFRDGELEQFLRERGWALNGPLPVSVPQGGLQFDVPFEVKPMTANGQA
jgi:predicted RNase H-like HicB family nuclease